MNKELSYIFYTRSNSNCLYSHYKILIWSLKRQLKPSSNVPIIAANTHFRCINILKPVTRSVCFKSSSPSLGIPKNDDYGVSPQKHLTNESVFVYWHGFFLALSCLRYLNRNKLACYYQHKTNGCVSM